MSLRDDGFRFLVNPDPFNFKWAHPAEVAKRVADGWVDVTEMSDTEYDAFLNSCA